MEIFKVGLSESNFIPTDIKYTKVKRRILDKKIKSTYFYIEANAEKKGEKYKIFGNLMRQEILQMTRGTKENKKLLKSFIEESKYWKKQYMLYNNEDDLRQAEKFDMQFANFLYIIKVTKEKPRHTYHEVFVKYGKDLKHGIKVEEASEHLEGGKWQELNKKLKPNVKFDTEKFKKFKRI